ncbi:putative DNA photolyase, putative,cryptochrome [Trypanosoma grayi]|uniref:putative DNA photolyase, putative,cryptochrome n=1 Tax=Trypanosoma grayi TaxID=71804 RepID=UPI0004F40853|nr:putative DNA photolyase, putative,cryptochrome [Trypanosoma grayi]KEG09455.1 putative DNA photolyase, putative,cryptochrome [Trypanosoma grayi]
MSMRVGAVEPLATHAGCCCGSCITVPRRRYGTDSLFNEFVGQGLAAPPPPRPALSPPPPSPIDETGLFASLEDDDGLVPGHEAVAAVASEFVVDAQELEAVAAHEAHDDACEVLLLPEQRRGEGEEDNNRDSKAQSLVVVTPASETWLAAMSSPCSYLCRQDALYLAAPTSVEAQLPVASTTNPSSCVMVVFAANDLRVHDNYTLALAAVRAEAAGGLPVIAVAVVDYRTFAQPSAVGGFFRQSPMRARFFLETLSKLRATVEEELQVPLLIRCGRPEEHIPRLAVECGATDVFLTTQYAPHEKCVHDAIVADIKRRRWVSRDAATGLSVTAHDAAVSHPYGATSMSGRGCSGVVDSVPHSVWQTTLVHIDDLPVPVAAMAEGERWYHDDVTVASIRPTQPYDRYIARLAALPKRYELLPSAEERQGVAPPPAYRGSIPTLEQLGYSNLEAFTVEEVIATQSSHPPGERAAVARVEEWLADGGVTSMLRYGRDRRTNTKMYSQRLSRVSPYLSNGSLSPRRFYEILRAHTSDNLRDSFVQMQYREALLRLSRRDYWHWMGLRYGPRLFYSYGPRPEQTDGVPDWRHDRKIVQKWCAGLTGVPFADAAMRELLTTGFVAHEGRQALAWLLTRGYGQDWRLGAEWLERCSLDYDPFLCYGNFAYFSELLRDDFGEPVRTIQWIAHHHDQTGIYVKKWLPVLSKIPPVYIHRPHVLTPRMQAMHGVRLGRNYPYPLKLWDGAQHTLGSNELTAYFDSESAWHRKAQSGAGGPGYAEALRHGAGIMKVVEWNAAVSPEYVACRPWVHHLPVSAFATAGEVGTGEEGVQHVVAVPKGQRQQRQQQQQQQQQVSLV